MMVYDIVKETFFLTRKSIVSELATPSHRSVSRVPPPSNSIVGALCPLTEWAGSNAATSALWFVGLATSPNPILYRYTWLEPAARTMSVTSPSRLTADVGREVLAVMRQLVEVAVAVEDGEDAVSRSAPLVAPYSSASVKDFVQKPVLISNATEESKKHYSATVQKTVQVTSSLLVAFLSDSAVDLLTKEKQKEFFAFLSRLPKDHGRKHGKNRYNSEGTPLTKLKETRSASGAQSPKGE